MLYDTVQSSYLRTCLKGLWVTLLRGCSYGERARAPTTNSRCPDLLISRMCKHFAPPQISCLWILEICLASAPSPTWIIVAMPLPFRPPGRDWLCGFWNISFILFILHYWKCFIISLSFLFLHRFYYLYHTIFIPLIYKTADTEDNSTHPFELETSTPPPPPPPVVLKGCVNWTSRSQRTLSRQRGGGGGLSRKGAPVPVPVTHPFDIMIRQMWQDHSIVKKFMTYWSWSWMTSG